MKPGIRRKPAGIGRRLTNGDGGEGSGEGGEGGEGCEYRSQPIAFKRFGEGGEGWTATGAHMRMRARARDARDARARVRTRAIHPLHPLHPRQEDERKGGKRAEGGGEGGEGFGVSLTIERPDVVERLGSTLSSGDLSVQTGRIGATDLIAALAYAQLNPDRAEHDPRRVASFDPRTELCSVLVRLKYAGDTMLGRRAELLLQQWLRHQKAFGRWGSRRPGDGGLVERFVCQCLAEWLFPVCQVCSGRKMLGIDRGEIVERRVRCTGCRGSGELRLERQHGATRYTLRATCKRCGGKGLRTIQRVRQGKLGECPGCMGTGFGRANDAERIRALGLDDRVYQKHWARRFSWMAAGLDRLDHLVKRCLQSQMREV